MIVTLIGYRGSGKSSVAGPLAARLGWGWIDADAEIEARAGRSIRDIFAAEGEAGFRLREREAMHDLLGRSDLVIAAGGGAVLDRATRHEMQAAGPVIWLRAPVDILIDRIAADASTADRRPNLTPRGGREEVERLLAEREPLYRACATETVDTAGSTVEEIVETVCNAIRPLFEDRQ